MDENRINRRSRPRPYDLRRKVLLKNFLREQMTYIPQPRLTSVQNIARDLSVEPSNSSELDEDLLELNDENSASSAINEADNTLSTENKEENSIVPNSNDDNNLNSTHKPTFNITSTDELTNESKFFRFASLMSLRSVSKKKKGKGILKAKKVCKAVKSPVKSKSFKSSLDRFFPGKSRISRESTHEKSSKKSSKSLFSLFKSRREQRKVKDVDRIKQSTSTDNKSPCRSEKICSSQSVQTDDTKEELSRVQESNKLLREENRLLSESLSYFVSSNSLDTQLNHCGSPLRSSNRNINSLRSSDCYSDRFSRDSTSYSNNCWNPRSRISRSKSVQEPSDRKHMMRNNYRTRSVNCHNNQSSHMSNRDAHSISTFSTQTGGIAIPRAKQAFLPPLPAIYTVRVMQRRSSMPERILSENDRSRICRRSCSVRDGNSRTPFHSLPSEAFY